MLERSPSPLLEVIRIRTCQHNRQLTRYLR